MSDSSSEHRICAPRHRNFLRLLAWRIPLTALLTGILYQIGSRYLPYSGDGHYTEELVVRAEAILMHSPLTLVVHKLFYWTLSPWGWKAWDAVALSSAVAGALAVQVLYALSRHPVFLIVNIASGSFLVFAGEVEAYAWVNLFLILTFLGVDRYIKGAWRLWPALLFFFVACALHMLALFYLPPLFWVMKKYPNFKPQEFLLPFLLFGTLYALSNTLFVPEGIDMDYTRLVPLFQINRKGQHFTFFEWRHWEILLYFHYLASFLWGPLALWKEYDPTVNFIAWKNFLYFGLPLEWPALLVLWKGIRHPFHKYLLFNTLIGLAWTTLWHPDLGKLDWDLFSQMYIPFHVLLGLLIQDRIQPLPADRTERAEIGRPGRTDVLPVE